MSNSEKPASAATVKSTADRRTFFIAFLTAIIVVTLYHVGMGLGRSFSGDAAPPVSQRYMLVPIMENPHHARPGFRRHAAERPDGKAPEKFMRQRRDAAPAPTVPAPIAAPETAAQ